MIAESGEGFGGAGKYDRVPTLLYVLAGTSLIPGIGIISAVGVLFFAAITKKLGRTTLIVVAWLGLLLHIALYATLAFTVLGRHGGIFDDLRTYSAKGDLNELVLALEVYRIQFGSYPDTLEELQTALPHNLPIVLHDPRYSPGDQRNASFYYKKLDDKYYLRGLTEGQESPSSSDILPDFGEPEAGKLGLLRSLPPPR